MPTARYGLAAATGLDGCIYAIGGYNGSYLNTVEAYNPSTNTWATVSGMHTAREFLGVASGPDNRIYAIGGYNGSYLPAVEAYTPSTDTWTTAANLPTARYGAAAITGSDGLIYVIGGYNGSVLNTVEAYTASSNTWATVASLPAAVWDPAAVSGPDGRIYVIGGEDSTSASTAGVYAYTPSSNTWATVASLPAPRFGLAAVPGLDGRIYAIAGFFKTSTGSNLAPAMDSVYAYTPGTDTWTTVASLPTARTYLGGTTGPDGRIYAIGGDPTNTTSTVLNITEAMFPAVASLSLSTNSLSTGSHSITAIYSGDTNFSGSTSATFLQTVNQASTSTTVTSSLNLSVFGRPVTFTATVSVSSPGVGTPTGMVTFKDGGTSLGTGALTGGTTATLASASGLSVATHTITAVYGGDVNFSGGTSGPLVQQVDVNILSWTGGGSSTNWSDANNWAGPSGEHVAPLGNDDLVFPAGAAQLTNNNDLAGGTSFHSLIFSGPGYTINGNQLALQAGIVTTMPAGTNAIAAPIVLTTAETFTSTFPGTQLNINGAVDTGGNTLTSDGSGNTAIGGVVSGAGGIVKNGAGTLSLNGANTYTGLTTINAGTVAISSSSGLGSSSAGTVVNPGGMLQLVGWGQFTLTQPLTLSGDGPGGDLPTTGSTNGALSIATSFAVSVSGGITLAGNASIGVGGSISGLTVTSNGVNLGGNELTINASNPASINAPISGSGGLIINGDGTTGQTTLSAVNTYTGSTIVQAGTLLLNGNGTLASTNYTINQGTLKLDNSGTNVTNRIPDAATITMNGGTFAFQGNAAANSTETISTITLAQGHSHIQSSAGGSFTAQLTSSNLVRNPGASADFSGTNLGTASNRIIFTSIDGLTPTARLVGNNGGILPYATFANNDFASYDASNGIKAFAGYASSIAAAGPGDTVKLSSNETVPASQTINALFIAGAFTATINPGATLTLGSGALLATGSSSIATGNGTGVATLAFGAEGIIWNTGGSTIISTAIAGSNGLTMSAGAITLQPPSGGNVYSGVTTLNGGSLTLPSSGGNPLGDPTSNSFNFYGGMLQPGSFATLQFPYAVTLNNASIGAGGFDTNITFSGPISLTGTNTFTIPFDSSTTWTGQVSGTGSLIVAGTGGNLGLTPPAGGNTYSGGTIQTADTFFPAGILIGSTPNALGTGPLTLVSGRFQTSVPVVLPNSVVMNNASLLLQANGSSANTIAFSGPVTLIGTNSVTTNVDVTISGSISGSGVLSKAGSNTLTLSGNGTHTGATAVSAGVLLLNGNQPAGPVAGTGGTIGGTGEHGLIATGSSAILDPGNPSTAPGLLSASGANLSNGGTLHLEVSGLTTPGVDFDRLNLGGNTLTLGGTSTLTLDLTGLSAPGTASGVVLYGSRFGTFTTVAVVNNPFGFTATPIYDAVAGRLDVQLALPSNGTAIGVMSAQNPAVLGQSVTFTATVSSQLGAPTGTVTFRDGSATLGMGMVNAGIATFSMAALALGSHSITAVYGGDSTFTGSTSGVLVETVNKPNTTAVATSSLNSSIFGQSVTLTASVTVAAPGSGTPTGTVTFLDGSSTLATVVLATGTASFSTSNLNVSGSPHSITVVYGGDANFMGSTSGSAAVTVSQARTTTSVASSTGSSVFGQSVTFTATVSNSDTSATPAGSVQFAIDGQNAGAAVNLNFVGTISPPTVNVTASSSYGSNTPNLAFDGNPATSWSAGAWSGTITAQFPSPIRFAGVLLSVGASPTTAETYTIYGSNDGSTFTQLAQSTQTVVQGSINTLAPITFTATTAQYLRISVNGGSSWVGINEVQLIAVGGNSNTATFTTSSLSPTGSPHAITATYVSDGNFGGSTSAAFLQTVNQGITTTNVTNGTDPSVFGQSVTFTATVSGSGGTPTGVVMFQDGGTAIGTGTLSGGSMATLACASGLSVGTHTITAVFSGDTNFSGGMSATLLQTVNQASTSATMSNAADPSVFGQSITFTATVSVTGNGAGTPTGTVTFQDGGTSIGTGSLSVVGSSDVAILTGPASVINGVGTHTITAVYGGDTNFVSSTSPALTQQVIDSLQTLIIQTGAANPGSPITITFQAMSAAGAESVLDSVNALAAQGTPVTIQLNLGGGTYSGLQASPPAGVTVYLIGSSGTTIIVGHSPALTVTSGTVVATDLVFETATPDPTILVQGGSLTMRRDVIQESTGSTQAAVLVAGGALDLGTTADPGNNILNINGLGEFVHNMTLDPVPADGDTFEINGMPLTAQFLSFTSLASSTSLSSFGQALTFTATVVHSSPGSCTPAGTVTFEDAGTSMGTGSLGSAGVATCVTASLTPGNHTITAVYGGDTNFTFSTSSSVTQTVNQADTTTTVTSSLNPTVFGQSVTFTATVSVTSPGAGTPTGTVTFRDGSTSIGTGSVSGATATFSTTTLLSAVTHTIKASYGGDTNFATSSGSVLQTVSRATTTTTVTTSVVPANPPGINVANVGQTVTIKAAVAGAPTTPTGTVTFLDGTISLGTGSVNGSGQATFTTSSLEATRFMGDHPHALNAVYSGDFELLDRPLEHRQSGNRQHSPNEHPHHVHQHSEQGGLSPGELLQYHHRRCYPEQFQLAGRVRYCHHLRHDAAQHARGRQWSQPRQCHRPRRQRSEWQPLGFRDQCRC